MRTTVVHLFVLTCVYHLVVKSSSDFWIRRHLGNGKLYEFNGTDLTPEDINSVDLQITATYIRKESATHPVHAIRISWDPAKNAAAYRVHCEANSTDDVVTIFDKEILNEVTEVDERFVLPRGPLSVICCVAAANNHGSTVWTYSPMVTIRSLNNESHRDSIKGEQKLINSDDLTVDQLLKLIRGSETVDLPTEPIVRPPEERVIVRPKPKNSFANYDTSSKHPLYKNLDLDVNEKDLERDYETVEKAISQSIGANDVSKSEHHSSLEISSFLNRPGNEKMNEFNGTDSSPDDVDSVDIQIAATYARKGSAIRPVHAVRISWAPTKNAAAYRVHCEANTTDEVVAIFDKVILNEVTEASGRFVLPRGPLSVICRVAATNKNGSSSWTYSPMVTIRTLNDESHRDGIRERRKSLNSGDMTADQVVKLIHYPETVDHSTEPTLRFPEERVIANTKHNGQNSFSIYGQQRPYKNLKFDIDEKEMENFETAEKVSKNERHKFLQMPGFLNRVL